VHEHQLEEAQTMLGTMQDEQLSLATLLRYGSSVHSDRTITTWTADGVRTMTFRELGQNAARLAHALVELGIGLGDRVATYMWNNNEHVVAYLAAPAMGAVLHPLNIRLFPEQIHYVANHARTRSWWWTGPWYPRSASTCHG
jgi:fatty-acyl-CoA synthase